MINHGRKMNAAAQFLKVDGQSMDNLVIVTKAQVEGLLYTPDGRRVVGVTFRRVAPILRRFGGNSNVSNTGT